jgi:hypothetical protein
LVRDALVVSAGRHRNDSASDHANDRTNDSGGYDAASATDNLRYDEAATTDAERLDATAAGHVFCLTSLKNARFPHCRRAARRRVRRL